MPKVNAVVTVSVPKSDRRTNRIRAILQQESRKLLLRTSLFVALVVIASFVLLFHRHAGAPSSSNHQAIVALAGHGFRLDIADTEALREQGLSNRPSLGDDEGMLFEFQQPDQACFWMKDMRFNLDILWFNANKELIYQKRNLSPSTYPESFCPEHQASYVVEIKPGIVSLATGDPLVLQNQ